MEIKREESYRLRINGGVLSPGELKYICEAAEGLGLDAISFGSRQDIIFPEQIDERKFPDFDKIKFTKPKRDGMENIVSSYVSADILPSTSWLTSDRYLYVLEQFKHKLKLRVNITDPKQRLVPLFTGNVNFVASEHEDYWYLYVRLPEWKKTVMYPALIYSWDMYKIERAIEKVLVEEPENIETLFELVSDAVDTNNRTVDRPLEVPFYPFPYYEGMNRFGDKYWLGLYWRNNRYDIRFLKAMCDLCAENKIGKISITPWKSFIVKGIPMKFKLQWEKFLGSYGINVRHSMLELNWHLPVFDSAALNLKKYLVTNFDQNDISTYGLTFGIANYESRTYHFTSIVIEKNKQPENLGDFVIRDTYNLLYAKNFDPNTREYIMHVQDVDKVELPGLLMELSKLYFEQLGTEYDKEVEKDIKKEVHEEEVYQCKECLTIYDQIYGDITQHISPNTAFENLPESYECSLCEAPKSSFEKKVLVK
ncbi:rubredoxin domain-containing protein [Aestuariibaculum suncheonense]|uniref:Rubredoxin domain-containing protein n=1 Tax=Aestuariibaculum suncheonense TaxID=1028745 RepID=A0A8J6QIY6_9FLAO|nr:rubredoxin domain-containing protein [Aestuariibaculum suncheonense]MBD0835821.1 rubredoxin domain-containing protein [Aestuariibaculum suncheonense]